MIKNGWTFLTLPIVLLVGILAIGIGALRSAPPDLKPYQTMIEKLKPLHRPLGKPQAGEWLDQHKEAGQSFAEYVRSDPVMPRGKRRIIYIQPLGDFNEPQRKIVSLTADFMGRYFGCKVKIRDDLPLSLIPDSAQRINAATQKQQILSTHVLDPLLKSRLPDEAAALIAFTATDLWPGQGWNFVFGQASLQDRVGVWSIARNGDPRGGVDALATCLLRTLKTATHETGHMFSIQHCTKYECNMCGSNSLEESDRQPVEVCPECLAKICFATGVDAKKRFQSLAEFCQQNKLEKQAAFYRSAVEALK